MAVVFVHGVSVGKERFDELLPTVRQGITGRMANISVEGFFWGNLATSLRYRGASIPGFLEGTRALEKAVVDRTALAHPGQLAALLLDDPYLELVTLRDTAEFDPAGAGFMPTPVEVATRNQALASRQVAITAALDGDHALQEAIGVAVPSHIIADIVLKAFDAAGRTDRRLFLVDLLDPLTRCLTAALYQAAVPPEAALEPRFAWTVVEGRVQSIVEQELGGQRGWIGDQLKNVALSAATMALRHGLRRRIMEALALFIGDVLVYLARRNTIMEELEKTVAASVTADNSPLWLVGHSLGGIMCFDYCCTTNREVERLVTVGSQVGLFGEFGALQEKPMPDGGFATGPLETPARVGSWLNLYDPDDILSFLAGPVFNRVLDIEIDTKAPFPASHSEYWNLPAVYEKLTWR